MELWQRLVRHRLAVVGLAILALLAATALLAPYIAPYNPNTVNYREALLPPGSPGHLLGTDELGRDLFSRLIYGARVSLTVGGIIVGLASVIGVSLGAVGAYYGRWVDNLIMRVVDVLYAFPFLLLAIAVVAVLGPSLFNVMITLAAVGWIGYARLVRGLVLSLREREYVYAARLVGATDRRILFRHILPNCLGPIIVQVTFDVAAAILAAAGLGFLGLGAQPPTAEWGAMLSTGQRFLRRAPHLSAFPGLTIMITVLALNFVGDGLRDALDPRLSVTSDQ